MGEYVVLGESGYTRPCLVALDMVLSGPLAPEVATVISDGDERLFILWNCRQFGFENIIIPNGFKSGYTGEGGRGFSLALCMLFDHHIPLNGLDVPEDAFRRIDSGVFPNKWREVIWEKAQPLEMPVPGWVLIKHWELTQNNRLWRVQQWINPLIDWGDAADTVDDFSWKVGDKFHQAIIAIRKNAKPETCQMVGLILRDAWIEFSLIIRNKLGNVPKTIGKNDVKAVMDMLSLPDSVQSHYIKAFDFSLKLQHDRRANLEKAKSCFEDSTTAMAKIVNRCFPGQTDCNNGGLIRPN